MSRFLYFLLAVALFALPARMEACTGIALSSANGARVLARTVEWAASPMQCGYAVVPRGYSQISFTPSGKDGLKFKAKYGYVGIYTDYQDFVVEGVNESGLSAGLFFFPAFGEYTPYVAKRKSLALCDLQVVSWVLSQFSSIDEIKRAIEKKEVDIISIDSRIGTVHWRFAEPGGRVVVLEFTEGKAKFYENPLGVLTNSPNFPWHMTNLANYINLRSGSSQPLQLAKDLQVKPLGGGTGMLGLPGDFTPPSRFVRAAMLQSSAPLLPDAQQTALQAFHLLNCFDIPIGLQHAPGQAPDGLPRATQFTSATAITPPAGASPVGTMPSGSASSAVGTSPSAGASPAAGASPSAGASPAAGASPSASTSPARISPAAGSYQIKFYYRTAWNSAIRCINLNSINFATVQYHTAPLDKEHEQIHYCN